jgi:hypothetical protein
MREDGAARVRAAMLVPKVPEVPEVPPAGPSGGAGTWRNAALIGVLWLLRLVTAAALAVDAYVHADLAPTYDFTNATISQGELFRIEAGAASLAALLLIVLGRRRLVWAFAFVVAAGGLFAVLLYRYVDVGAFGPFANMYEPFWYAEKTHSAIAEGIGTGTALIGFLLVCFFVPTVRRASGLVHLRGRLSGRSTATGGSAALSR